MTKQCLSRSQQLKDVAMQSPYLVYTEDGSDDTATLIWKSVVNSVPPYPPWSLTQCLTCLTELN